MMLAALGAAGLHPLELSTSSHFSVAGVDVSFPIDVPVSEAEDAREMRSSQFRRGVHHHFAQLSFAGLTIMRTRACAAQALDDCDFAGAGDAPLAKGRKNLFSL
jgi:hypothetical protein